MSSAIRGFASVVFSGARLLSTDALALPSSSAGIRGASMSPAGIAVVIVGGLALVGTAFWFFSWYSKRMMRDMSDEAKKRLKAAGIEEPTEADRQRVAALHGEGPTATAWQQRMAAAVRASGKNRDFFWFPDVPEARALVRDLLTEVASRLGSGQVKDKQDDQTLELRGVSGGAPFRIAVNNFGSVGDVEMQCDNRVGPFAIHRDMDKVPQAVDPNDP
jgi:hypothetical protein